MNNPTEFSIAGSLPDEGSIVGVAKLINGEVGLLVVESSDGLNQLEIALESDVIFALTQDEISQEKRTVRVSRRIVAERGGTTYQTLTILNFESEIDAFEFNRLGKELLASTQGELFFKSPEQSFRATEQDTSADHQRPENLIAQASLSKPDNRRISDRFKVGEFLRGTNGSIRLADGVIEIFRNSLMADIVIGQVRGSKIIPLRHVQAVQFKDATSIQGAIEFVVSGDMSVQNSVPLSTGYGPAVDAIAGRSINRAANENTITFKKSQGQEFRKFFDYLVKEIKSLDRPAGEHSHWTEHLERAARLRDQGHLTEAEFDRAKMSILESGTDGLPIE